MNLSQFEDPGIKSVELGKLLSYMTYTHTHTYVLIYILLLVRKLYTKLIMVIITERKVIGFTLNGSR